MKRKRCRSLVLLPLNELCNGILTFWFSKHTVCSCENVSKANETSATHRIVVWYLRCPLNEVGEPGKLTDLSKQTLDNPWCCNGLLPVGMRCKGSEIWMIGETKNNIQSINNYNYNYAIFNQLWRKANSKQTSLTTR